ncbi:O-methyltransferase [Bacillus kwashiorkori]|uniref:O-methyltransferase n=1 Tax=Bacillus kwashiorkori TaxID=1522318 RepID=UPI000785A04C|nr:O-methyltransferase [Bacillus kwashiorkori]
MINGDHLNSYLQSFISERSPFFQEMERYAKENCVPIMDPYSMETVLQLLRLYKPKNMLEIGTAIGYSALRFAEAVPNIKILTIERDNNRAKLAHTNIQQANRLGQITMLEGDAFDLVLEVAKYAPFDCLFIDAAKGQYQRFFQTFEPYLAEQALIITDNVLFKGYVYSDNENNNRLKKLGKKIHHYNEWLIQNPSYQTVILPVGDGIAISIKQK